MQLRFSQGILFTDLFAVRNFSLGSPYSSLTQVKLEIVEQPKSVSIILDNS
jgi:hypothetical protein